MSWPLKLPLRSKDKLQQEENTIEGASLTLTLLTTPHAGYDYISQTPHGFLDFKPVLSGFWGFRIMALAKIDKKRTVPGLRTWSPTVLLTGPDAT